MSTISAASVNELRKKTDQPLMECKKALTESGGDMDKAVELLRTWNAKAGVKREANETAEGRVGVYIAGDKAAILEVRCESAPTAKNDLYIKLVNDLAKNVVEEKIVDVAALIAAKKDRIDEVVGVIREKMVPHRFERLEGGIFGSYIHHDGTVGVLIQCKGEKANDEVLRDVCAHAAALNPPYLKSTDVPAETVEKEKTFAMTVIKEDPKNAGKPENIIAKIAEGKLKTWFGETVLLEQQMANAGKYPNTTIGALLAKHGLTAEKVVRYKVGAQSV